MLRSVHSEIYQPGPGAAGDDAQGNGRTRRGVERDAVGRFESRVELGNPGCCAPSDDRRNRRTEGIGRHGFESYRAREVFGECLGEFDAGDRRNLSDVDRVRCYVESQGRNGCISDVEM